MSTRGDNQLADTIHNVMVSPNVSDSNGEAANIVDVIDNHGRCMLDAAVKIERGLASIALAIGELAEAIRERSA